MIFLWCWLTGLVSLEFASPQWGAGKSCAESVSKLSDWTLRACSMVHCVFYFLYIWKWSSLDCCQIRVLESFVIWIANVLLAFGWVYLSIYFSLNVFVCVCVWEFSLHTKEIEGRKCSSDTHKTLLALFSDEISREAHEISLSFEFSINTEVDLVASLSSQKLQQVTCYG